MVVAKDVGGGPSGLPGPSTTDPAKSRRRCEFWARARATRSSTAACPPERRDCTIAHCVSAARARDPGKGVCRTTAHKARAQRGRRTEDKGKPNTVQSVSGGCAASSAAPACPSLSRESRIVAARNAAHPGERGPQTRHDRANSRGGPSAFGLHGSARVRCTEGGSAGRDRMGRGGATTLRASTRTQHHPRSSQEPGVVLCYRSGETSDRAGGLGLSPRIMGGIPAAPLRARGRSQGERWGWDPQSLPACHRKSRGPGA